MRFSTYQVRGRSFVTLYPEADRLYWKLRGEEMRPEGQYSSFGQAFRKTGDQGFPGGRFHTGAGRDTLMESDALHLQRELGGRALTLDEVLRWGEGFGSAERTASALQWLCLTGRASVFPGVDDAGPALRRRCRRCGGKAGQIRTGTCARCGGKCAWCDQCVILGKSRACTPFFLLEPACDRIPPGNVEMERPILSPSQRDAARECLRWLSGEGEELLVWGVIDAGRKEMVFPAVCRTMEEGGRVLWLSPRKEEVIEVAERMRSVFPGTRVAEVHGDAGAHWADAELTCATAPQAIRFYHRFQLVVVDEGEADLLNGVSGWWNGIRRAAAVTGKRIQLTVTPSRSRRRRARRRNSLITVPVRYHGFPLPVPEVSRVWRFWRKVEHRASIPALETFLTGACGEGGQVLLFVPGVPEADSLLQWIRNRTVLRKVPFDAATGGDPDQSGKIHSFLTGELKGLVTTPSVGKGVAVPRCHIGVAGADHPVFQKAVLIEIAGKAGRSGTYPKGRVCFFPSVRTEAQIGAIRDIREWNRLAAKRGYLRTEGEEP